MGSSCPLSTLLQKEKSWVLASAGLFGSFLLSYIKETWGRVTVEIDTYFAPKIQAFSSSWLSYVQIANTVLHSMIHRSTLLFKSHFWRNTYRKLLILVNKKVQLLFLTAEEGLNMHTLTLLKHQSWFRAERDRLLWSYINIYWGNFYFWFWMFVVSSETFSIACGKRAD